MRDETPPWDHGVVLVCTHQRDPDAAKPSCGREAGLKLRQWLKQAARAEDGPAARCRVLATGCLDVCPHDGVTVGFEPGHRAVVVDPEADREALLALTRAHFEGLTATAAAGKREKARRALGRLLK
ncbi:MAG: hypothetical protein H6739_16900 [Alphaproteobacteria bacterium]|nr:hypothetical protein [Alphaproteobacteria bacterium]